MSAEITRTPEELLVVSPEEHSTKQSVLGIVAVPVLLWLGYRWFVNMQLLLESLVATHIGTARLLLSFVLFVFPGLASLAAFWMVLNAFRPLFHSRQVLRCTPDGVELESIDFGRVWRKRTFARDGIQSAAFGAVSVSKYGATNGLLLRTRNKTIKALPGLKARQAREILENLQQLGFQVEIDPAMKMVIDMEESRKRFWA